MSARTALFLARPAAAADRRRALLVAAATALAGGLLLAAARIARYTAADDAAAAYASPSEQLAPYVEEAGLRPGVVLGVALLLVPVLALAVQALRVGSLARDRRMAALRLAGATPGDVRAVAAAEAGGAALLGGLAAGPAYLGLWLLLGLVPPADLRLVPAPDALDLALWPAVAVLAGVGGAVAGAAVERRVAAEPLGVQRRARPERPGRVGTVTAVLGLVLLVAGLAALAATRSGTALLLVLIAGALLVALGSGPRLVQALGRRLRDRGGAEELLAGRRLEADPAAPGRVAAVLAICGVALGIDAVLVGDLLAEGTGGDLGFYLGGAGLAALGVLLAAAVALVALLVGAADQLLDARRSLAALAALGVDEATLERALRRQVTAAAVPALVLGTLVGGTVFSIALVAEIGLGAPLLATLVAAALAGPGGAFAARVATRLLRPRLRAAAHPENLRAA